MTGLEVEEVNVHVQGVNTKSLDDATEEAPQEDKPQDEEGTQE